MTQIKAAFLSLYEHIRRDKWFRNVTILYAIENNFGNDANWLYDLTLDARRMRNVHVLCEHPTKKIGFCTSEESKLTGYTIIQSFASVGGIKFYKELITINLDNPKNGREAMRALFIGQLRQLKQYGKKRMKGKNLVVITGIHSEDGKRLNLVDDVSMAFNVLAFTAIRWQKRDLDAPYEEIAAMKYKIVHPDEEAQVVTARIAKFTRQYQETEERRDKTGLFTN